MAGLLVKRVLWRVSTTLVDAKPQFTRFSERDMVTALQSGVRALCKYLPQAGSRNLAIKLAPGSRQSIAKIPAASIKTYDGSNPVDTYAILLLEVIRNMGANGTTPGAAIAIADRQRLDRQSPGWHTTTGAAVRQYTYNPQDPLTFYVTPAVPAAGDAVWVDVSLVAPPKVIPDGGAAGSELYRIEGNNTELVGVDDQYEDDLWNYCCAYLLLSDAKAQGALNRAAVHVQAFNASINSMAAAMTGHNPNLKQLPFAPDIAGAAS